MIPTSLYSLASLCSGTPVFELIRSEFRRLSVILRSLSLAITHILYHLLNQGNQHVPASTSVSSANMKMSQTLQIWSTIIQYGAQKICFLFEQHAKQTIQCNISTLLGNLLASSPPKWCMCGCCCEALHAGT